ncbi:MAG: hypothetical protein WBD31_12170 [Rubripirellula sp.]
MRFILGLGAAHLSVVGVFVGAVVSCPAMADSPLAIEPVVIDEFEAESPDAMLENGWTDDEARRCAEQRKLILGQLIQPITSLTASTKNDTGLKPRCPPLAAAMVMDSAPLPAEFGVHWVASGVRHRPLYFEDVNLERYGHHYLAQPLVSGVRFFGSAIVLPLRMCADKPCECETSLGLKRPGDPTCPVCRKPVALATGGK